VTTSQAHDRWTALGWDDQWCDVFADTDGVPARVSIAGKGTITIRTVNMDANVKVTIADTGRGMSEEVKAKIFQPFFTTKGLGEGTGLGLSITFGIIDKHKGKVTVDSEKGKGTIFTIVIPKQHQMLRVPVMATVG
jgi:signal transduction histidine kinase